MFDFIRSFEFLKLIVNLRIRVLGNFYDNTSNN